jgi:hypothetical protein
VGLQNRAGGLQVSAEDNRKLADIFESKGNKLKAQQLRMEAEKQETEAIEASYRGQELEKRGRDLQKRGHESIERGQNADGEEVVSPKPQPREQS